MIELLLESGAALWRVTRIVRLVKLGGYDGILNWLVTQKCLDAEKKE